MRSLNRKRRQGASSENHPTSERWRGHITDEEVRERMTRDDRQLDCFPTEKAMSRVQRGGRYE